VCTHNDAHWDFSECAHSGSVSYAPPLPGGRIDRQEYWLWDGLTWTLIDTVPVEGDLLHTPPVHLFIGLDPTQDLAALIAHGPAPTVEGWLAAIPYRREAFLALALYQRCADPAEQSPDRLTCLTNQTIYTNGTATGHWARETFTSLAPTERLPRQGFLWSDGATTPGARPTYHWAVGLRRYLDSVNGAGGSLFFLTNAYLRAGGLDAPDAACVQGTHGKYTRDWRSIPPNALEVRTDRGVLTLREGVYLRGMWGAGPSEDTTPLHVLAAWDNALSGLEVPHYTGENVHFPTPVPLYRRRTTPAGWADLGVTNPVNVFAQDREAVNLLVTRQPPTPVGGPIPRPVYRCSVDGGEHWYDWPGTVRWDPNQPGYIVEA
jgi:hypothetical protein